VKSHFPNRALQFGSHANNFHFPELACPRLSRSSAIFNRRSRYWAKPAFFEKSRRAPAFAAVPYTFRQLTSKHLERTKLKLALTLCERVKGFLHRNQQ
jgi:hypothetical protein